METFSEEFLCRKSQIDVMHFCELQLYQYLTSCTADSQTVFLVSILSNISFKNA